jgi:hypothetical protein
MPDGRNNFETKEVTVFGGLNASNDPTKPSFPDSDSPFIKNFLNKNGILEARPGRSRINSTRYNNEITSIIAYTDRSDVTHLVFSVKSVAVDPVAPNGTITETH